MVAGAGGCGADSIPGALPRQSSDHAPVSVQTGVGEATELGQDFVAGATESCRAGFGELRTAMGPGLSLHNLLSLEIPFHRIYQCPSIHD